MSEEPIDPNDARLRALRGFATAYPQIFTDEWESIVTQKVLAGMREHGVAYLAPGFRLVPYLTAEIADLYGYMGLERARELLHLPRTASADDLEHLAVMLRQAAHFLSTEARKCNER